MNLERLTPATSEVVRQEELTAREAQQLQAAEADIERGGELLTAGFSLIREKRLYRATHSSFEAYCRERWGKTVSAVYKSIHREEVVRSIMAVLEAEGEQPMRISHRAAAEVADMPAEAAARVVKAAAKGERPPTANAVREAREQAERKDTPPQSSPTVMLDSAGRRVPHGLKAAASNAAALEALARRLDPIRADAERLAGEPGGEFLQIAEVNRLIRELKTAIAHARYWTHCPRCDGKGCERCASVGYLPFSRRNLVSPEFIAKIEENHA
jgi:hypothetical protein